MKGRNVNAGQHLPAEVYSREVVEALLGQCGGGVLGARNRALLGILYDAGLRVREALDLQLHDVEIDARGGRLHVRSGKGGKQRVVALRAHGARLVDAYIRVRGDRPGALLLGRDGGTLDTSAVRMLLPRLARRAGVRQRVHAHGMRHTHAIELCQAGVPVPYIQRQLGHARLAVTERYLNHVTPEAVLDAVLGSEG